MELEMRAYTVAAHGASVARKHLHDWLILILLTGIVVLLYFIEPFYRFISKDMMTDLKYPFKPNAIPVWAVPIYTVVLPVIVFVIRYCKRKDVHDLHHAVLGLMYSVLITGVFTEAIKVSVGRPRPNFFWRCFPDGEEAYDDMGNVACHGDHSIIKEGYKSFPSGHTSWSFAGLGFLSLYLSGKIRAFDQTGHAAKLCIVLLPLLAAALVAVSRVDDYWHHWQDVFAGALIGEIITIICYLQFFPLPHHTQGWGPYAYFKAIEQDAKLGPPASTVGVQAEGDGSNNPHLSSVHQQEDHKITME